MIKLILASASIGREFLLKGLKIPYTIIPSNINEEKTVGKSPVETIRLRAKLKGEYVAKKLITHNLQPTTLILSADTEVILGNQLLGKPKDYKDAVKMLKMLSGKTHEVISAYYIIKATKTPRQGNTPGVCRRRNTTPGVEELPLVKGSKIYHGYDRSRVTLRRLKDEDIKLYLSITNYTRYTGSYALIASPQNFITKIEGSISNVIGLPLEKVIPILASNNLLSYT